MKVKKPLLLGAFKIDIVVNEMDQYDPLTQPNTEEWLGATENERVSAVREYHEKSNEDLDEKALAIHSAIHVIVETQLAIGVELLPETMAKLIRQGLNRHEAIHAIGAIISGDILAIIRGEKTESSPKQYRKKFEKITAKRWRKGQY
ncbi:MAG: hypothetical protein KZQ99_21965 [Candidatus Thiodiazotropha sp. (ex Dulcina madagascariensis)]|nr:hypothetical protein [Candidatus Thiodiazotropha sp. (ex Dulcina madagascariensis)]